MELGLFVPSQKPAGTYAREIYQRLIIDLAWNSSRLEGNTYSMLETKRLIELGEIADGKNMIEAQMILNHKAAIEFLVDVDQDIYLKALLGIYEKNDVSLFCDLFMWAYKRSTQRYSAIQESIGEPNFLKLKYRDIILEIIQSIVRGKIPGKQVASQNLNRVKKMNLSTEDSRKVLEILELEIVSLHEGNIARYQIRLSEFNAWLNVN